MEPVEFTVVPTEEGYVALRVDEGRSSRRVAALMFWVGGLALSALLAFLVPWVWVAVLVFLAGAAAACFAAWVVSSDAVAQVGAREVWRREPEVRDVCHYEVYETHLVIRSLAGVNHWSWNALPQVTVTPARIAVGTRLRRIAFWPREAIPSEDWTRLDELLRRRAFGAFPPVSLPGPADDVLCWTGTVDEAIAVQRWAARSVLKLENQETLVAYAALAVTLVVIHVMLVAFLLLAPDVNWRGWLFGWLLLATFYMPMVITQLSILINAFLINREIRRSPDALVQRVEVQAGPWGVAVGSGLDSGWTPWDRIRRVRQIPGFLVLEWGQSLWMGIPVRAFGGPEGAVAAVARWNAWRTEALGPPPEAPAPPVARQALADGPVNDNPFAAPRIEP